MADVAEAGNGQGSYDISETVWHVDCCNPETDDGWDVFNAVLGWQNTATYCSIISYNVSWIFLLYTLACMMYEEKTDSLPLKKQILKFLLKIPVVKTWARKKMAVSQVHAANFVRQGKEHWKEMGRRPIADDFNHGFETKKVVHEIVSEAHTIEG